MSINALSCVQSIISKKIAAQSPIVYTKPLQPAKLRIWYKFAGNVTNSAPNYSGSNNGTIVNGSGATNTQIAVSPAISANTSVTTMCTFNGGATSSGAYSFINLQTISSLTLSDGFTICMFIYSTKTSGGDTYIFALNNPGISGGTYAGGLCISQSATSPYNKYVFNNAGTTNAVTLTPNTWVHYAVTINSSNLYNVYLNGVLTLSNITNPFSYPTATNFTLNSLGSYSPIGPHNTFKGNMADFRLYNSVLSAGEITAIYNGTG